MPPPHVAVVEDDGLTTYRAEMMSVRVESRNDGLRALVVELDGVRREMLMDASARARLAALLADSEAA